MSSSIFEMLNQQLTDRGTLDQIGRQIGARDNAATQKAVQMGLAGLMGGLAKNAQQGSGAEALAGALDRDHDGSILDNLGGFLGNPDAGNGEGILKHVFGEKRQMVEAGIGQQAGLDSASVQRLLKMLAPILLGALAKQKRSNNLDAGALRDMLGGERATVERKVPQLGGLASLLDRDGDGSVADDVAKLGGGLLKSFFGKR